MKVTRYFIEEKEDVGRLKCCECGKPFDWDEVSYEFRPDNLFKATKEEIERIWCKDCLPKDAEVYKGTQLHSFTGYRKNLKRGIR